MPTLVNFSESRSEDSNLSPLFMNRLWKIPADRAHLRGWQERYNVLGNVEYSCFLHGGQRFFGSNEYQKYVIFGRKPRKTERNRAFQAQMVKCRNQAELHAALASKRQQGQSIGFVPTMGALHAGHESLVAAAKAECETVVISIFVNPTQFNEAKDFHSYPNTLEQDLERAEAAGADCVYLPSVDELYQGNLTVEPVDYGNLTHSFEGSMRRGHFDGVVAVVRKLFQAVQPNRAYFGEKDLQQLAVIRRLAEIEFPGLKIVGCPLVRDVDGLALSSRNVRLTGLARNRALKLNAWIRTIQREVESGARVDEVLQAVREAAQTDPEVKLEYLDLINPNTFEPWSDAKDTREAFAVVAAQVDGVRLIDNCRVMCS